MINSLPPSLLSPSSVPPCYLPLPSLQALVDALMEKDTLIREEFEAICAANGVVKFEAEGLAGFGWDEDGQVTWPPAEGGEGEGTRTMMQGEGGEALRVNVEGATARTVGRKGGWPLTVQEADMAAIDALLRGAEVEVEEVEA